MKKSLIALAVLGAFAGAASAQSSVTIYGFVDVAAAKPIGTQDKQIVDGAQFGGGSRLGFRGEEDLGGGWKGVFGMEHRFSADTGTQSNATNFWQGYSTVGIVSPYGAVRLGRQYTPAFLMIQNQIDPFGGESVAQGRDTGMRFGGVTKVRVADSIRYDLAVGGFSLGASVAEGDAANGGGVAGAEHKPVSFAANYVVGPVWLGVGYENPADDQDKVWNIGGRYNFGFMTLAAGYGKGTTAAGVDTKGWLVGATVPVGAVDIKVMYATNNVDNLGDTRKIGVGAHYNFSKRTKVYVDYGKVSGDLTAIGAAVDANSTGYDLGIKHVF
ncbi:MAG: porin [Burkholderiaceae bacterium]